MSEKKSENVLGIDLGVGSVGWALVSMKAGEGRELVDAGVRVFTFDADFINDYEAGKSASLALGRREARARRRLVERRGRRMAKLRHILQGAGLLPMMDEEKLAKEFIALDARILAERRAKGDERFCKGEGDHKLTYILRAIALDERLGKHEVGRAIYQLAQRRGFLSNRKAPVKKDDDAGKVKDGIRLLTAEMAGGGARTLGEHLAGMNPLEVRIRNRYTSRKMLTDEFDAIWEGQKEDHEKLKDEDFKKEVWEAIFKQRPLKSAKELVGHCRFERNARRCAWAMPLAQRFRLVQMVGNTMVDVGAGYVELAEMEREKLIEVLERDGDQTFAKAKKLLGLKRTDRFNWQEGGEKRFPGNRTNGKLSGVFGEAWWEFDEKKRLGIVQDCASIQSRALMVRRAKEVWGLDREKAEELGDVELEKSYAALSAKAMRKLLPLMEEGMRYGEAVKKVYGEDVLEHAAPMDMLPSVLTYIRDLRNPVVFTVLTQLRRVVNAVVKKHGKPDVIRVELARDLKKTARDRSRITKKNRANEGSRSRAAARITAEAGVRQPSRDDVQKVQLADECEWRCPYTGKTISMGQLVGPHPAFDIEHIIPLSRSFDNSYYNKTLCASVENRSVKHNKTPWEAYSGNAERYAEILERVSRFKGDAAREKLKRFKMETTEELDDFSTRQLNDTRYASKLAAEYLGFLYGGVIDGEGRRRVQATRGGVTGFLRNEWCLNGILSDGPGKSRDDHRHHAVDAVVTALTTPSAMGKLSEAAVKAAYAGRRRFAPMDEPWDGFVGDVREAVAGIAVAHRQSRKVSGKIHKETFYSLPMKDGEGRECYHVRKAIGALTAKEVENIVDDAVRKAVKAKLAESGLDAKRTFADLGNHPVLANGKPVHRARVRKYDNPTTYGKGRRARRALVAGNHHLEILEVRDGRGDVKWEAEMVTRLGAMRRVSKREPVVNMGDRDGKRFVFSIAPGDTIELEDKLNVKRLCIVRGISISKGGRILVTFVADADARRKKDIQAAGEWGANSLDTFRTWNCRKVLVTPGGDVRYAND